MMISLRMAKNCLWDVIRSDAYRHEEVIRSSKRLDIALETAIKHCPPEQSDLVITDIHQNKHKMPVRKNR